MKLELHRVEEDAAVLPDRENKRTRGTLFINGVQECHTLEDEVRIDDPRTPQNEGAKIKGKTAIPAGTYPIRATWSGKFGRTMPEVCEVPNYSGIRIHSGHDETHTEGCLLTAGGFDKDGDIIPGTSKPASQALEAKVMAALGRNEPVFITITNDFLAAV